MKTAYSVLVIYFIGIFSLFAQLRDFAVEFGTSPIRLFGNENTTKVIIPHSSADTSFGGGFFGFQNAFSLKGVWTVSKSNKLFIPFGLEYSFLRALHRIPLTRFVTAYIKHSIDLPTFTIGVRYYMFKLPFASVNAYVEPDLRGSFVGKSNYSQKIEYELSDSLHIRSFSGKSGVFRLGAGLKLGVVGEVVPPVYVNIYCGVSGINFFNRDDSRGELLTPLGIGETKENLVYSTLLGILIQYHFGK